MKPATLSGHAADSKQADVRPGLDERANRYDVVSELADDLAHEIRNPLNAIVINLENLRKRIDAHATDGALALTDVIDQEVMRLSKLVDQLVLLMRPPRSESHPTSVDETVDDMRPLLETQASAARVGSFALTTSSDLFTRVPRDVVKFALLNLITAVYANNPPERLRVETRAARQGAEVVVTTQPATFRDGGEYVARARALIEAAGGALTITEQAGADAGSTAVLRFPGSSSIV